MDRFTRIQRAFILNNRDQSQNKLYIYSIENHKTKTNKNIFYPSDMFRQLVFLTLENDFSFFSFFLSIKTL